MDTQIETIQPFRTVYVQSRSRADVIHTVRLYVADHPITGEQGRFYLTCSCECWHFQQHLHAEPECAHTEAARQHFYQAYPGSSERFPLRIDQ